MTEKPYITGNKNLKNYGDWIEESSLIQSKADLRTFLDVDTNISVRSEMVRSDYDYYRPTTRIPEDPIGIIKACSKAYQRIGIVRNVIDLMAEFASKGIKLQHKNPRIESFYQEWFKKVNGKDRSERFLNLLYRQGNVVIKRTNGRISAKIEKEWKKSKAEEQIVKREIPLRYYFLNPNSLEVIGGGLSTFVGKLAYSLKLNAELVKDLSKLTKEYSDIIQTIPPDILNQIKTKGGISTIKLDQDKLHVYFYKKDDWQVWAEPMTYGILDDLQSFEKMRLADIAALDGAISNIRLWRIGIIDPSNFTNNLLPTRTAINKLKNILHNNTGGGVMDLVWGPELDFKESNTEVYRFLGSQKYETTLNCIYDGLGVPPTLRSGSKGGNTGSFIALKTLVERLQYGRDVLISFWQEQIEMVQKAMGFSSPAQISFDKIILSDESTILALLVQLADRDYISMDSLLEKFGELPGIEKSRLFREKKQRGRKLPAKLGPYSSWDDKIIEMLVKMGAIDPSELGLDVNIKKGWKPPIGTQTGRPPNVIETQKRKPKPQGKPRTTAELTSLISWSTSAHKKVSDMLIPCVLSCYNKKNCRQLTNDQAKEVEYLKFSVLLGFEPFEQITQEKVYNIMNDNDLGSKYVGIVQSSINKFTETNKIEPTLDELRSIYISTYVMGCLNGQG